MRPEFRLAVLVAGTLAAATLLSGVHWLALRTWRNVLPGCAARAREPRRGANRMID